MRILIASLISTTLAVALIGTAQAEIVVTVDKSAQRMTVKRDGEPLYSWPVSTGRSGYATPSGSYTAFRMEADHYSKEWDDAPMPYSIFFTKIGHAIHGSYATNKLGMPASHGCVRLSPTNAATLFALVEREGVTNTKVILIGSEQVALARNGVRNLRDQDDVRELWMLPPLNSNSGYDSDYAERYVNPNDGNPQRNIGQQRYVNPNGEYRQLDRAPPRYVSPNYGYARPQYIQPQYGQPFYRY